MIRFCFLSLAAFLALATSPLKSEVVLVVPGVGIGVHHPRHHRRHWRHHDRHRDEHGPRAGFIHN